MKIKILFSLLFFTTIVFSQNKGLVYYGYIEAVLDGNAKGADSNAYLVFNKEQSYYVTAKDSLEKTAKINSMTVYKKNYEGKREYTGKRSAQGDQVVYNIKANTMWSNLYFDKQIYVKDEATKLNWKLSTESKKIGNFLCKKATTFFRGRNYTAWYTSKIAIPFGPWKLHGLPGLILEAYDTEKNVYWYFKSAEYPSNTKENVNSIRKAKGGKPIQFVNQTAFNKFRLDRQEEAIDVNRMNQKNFKGVIFIDPKLSELFVEFE